MSRTVHVLAGLLLLSIGFAAGWICRQPVEPTRPTELQRPPLSRSEFVALCVSDLKDPHPALRQEAARRLVARNAAEAIPGLAAAFAVEDDEETAFVFLEALQTLQVPRQ